MKKSSTQNGFFNLVEFNLSGSQAKFNRNITFWNILFISV